MCLIILTHGSLLRFELSGPWHRLLPLCLVEQQLEKVIWHLGGAELEREKRFFPWVLQGNRIFWTLLTGKVMTVLEEAQSSEEVKRLPLSALSSPTCLFFLLLFVLSTLSVPLHHAGTLSSTRFVFL